MFAEKFNQYNSERLFSLTGKVALITGAGGHLGTHLSYCLGQAGAHLILNGRDKTKLALLQEQLAKHGIHSTLLPFDVTNNELLKENLAKITEDFPSLNIIVNNAHAGRACVLDEATPEDFFRDYHVNVVASFELIKACRGLLKKSVALSGDASVINIASMYGMVSPDPRIYLDSKMNNPPFYGAAKSALIQLTRYMACHLAPEGIRVNAISPGPFPAQAAKLHPAFMHNLQQKVPLGRVGEPEELQGPLLFLASNASSYVTGINLAVDGGWTSW